jgi:pimeloyl-ACP methyl ester carboxylesterase
MGLTHGVGGEISVSGALVEEMMREVAEDVTGVRVAGTGHWVPEEKPEASVRAVLDLLGRG